MVQKIKKVLPHTFQSCIAYCIVLLSLINIINSVGFQVKFIVLVENQILYIYSAIAQVVGALLGLTIAGYSVIDSKLKSIGESDSSISEYTEDLRKDYFSSLMMIIILSVLDILLCIYTLCSYNNFFETIVQLLMNQSVLLFIFILIEIVYFVNFLSPNKIKQKGSADKEIIELSFQNNRETVLDNDSFSPFVTYYNLLEKLVKDYASELVNNPNSTNKLGFTDSIYILVKFEIIDKQTSSIVDDLRRYRNALVHSLETDKTVKRGLYLELERIYTKLKEIYDSRNDEKLFNEKKLALFNYSEQLGYGETDKKIISYLKQHSQASISEVSEYANITKEATLRKLTNLQKLGLLKSTGNPHRNQWSIND